MDRPRRVLFVCPVGSRGGAESVMLSLWRHLDWKRIEPCAFFLRDGPFVEEARGLGMQTRLEPISRLLAPASFIRAVEGIGAFARLTHAELIVDSLGYAHLYGALAARLNHLPAVWWDHALASRSQWLDRLAATLPTDLVITASERAAIAHRQLYPAARTFIVHPGLDPEEWEAARTNLSGAARSELGISGAAQVITSIARLEVGKGQDVLLRAAARILPDYPDIRILLVGGAAANGGGGFTADLARMAGELGLAGHVDFLGVRQDIYRILSLTDVYVHPARFPESFGLSILEAMICGKPIVATRVGGPEEILDETGAGLLVRAEDPDAMADALAVLLQSSSLRDQMGQAAKLRAQSFNANRMVEAFSSAVDEVLRN